MAGSCTGLPYLSTYGKALFRCALALKQVSCKGSLRCVQNDRTVHSFRCEGAKPPRTFFMSSMVGLKNSETAPTSGSSWTV
jgi:hypothetical protein